MVDSLVHGNRDGGVGLAGQAVQQGELGSPPSSPTAAMAEQRTGIGLGAEASRVAAGRASRTPSRAQTCRPVSRLSWVASPAPSTPRAAEATSEAV